MTCLPVHHCCRVIPVPTSNVVKKATKAPRGFLRSIWIVKDKQQAHLRYQQMFFSAGFSVESWRKGQLENLVLSGVQMMQKSKLSLHCRVGEKVEKVWEDEEERDKTCYKADSE